ncbi:MAG: hypothetical protein JWO60_1844 [Frankiales bacterium]|nr:hypothetical protein [Frankiales bacterium]
MTVAPSRRLSLVPAQPEDDLPHVVVPVPRASDAATAAPWHTQGDVAYVPAVLLLAASGRCSCEDCCAVLADRMRTGQLSAV